MHGAFRRAKRKMPCHPCCCKDDDVGHFYFNAKPGAQHLCSCNVWYKNIKSWSEFEDKNGLILSRLSRSFQAYLLLLCYSEITSQRCLKNSNPPAHIAKRSTELIIGSKGRFPDGFRDQVGQGNK